MKPTWDDAPEWAEWLAQDYDGEWFWFEFKPLLSKSGKIYTPSRDGKCEEAFKHMDKAGLLERRPK